MSIAGNMGNTEINFDGIIGPTHNYAGLSFGNLASARHAGGVSHPRAAALQGVAKMRTNLDLGLVQGVLMPLARPDRAWLTALGTTPESAGTPLLACALSASSMWAANAATVSPAMDSVDGKCHMTVANLVTMPHRSHEWAGTLAQLQIAFAHPAFAVHLPVPAPFGDEGAANHMRFCDGDDASGVEVFVYGTSGGAFPARQQIEASRAVARVHLLEPASTIFAEQSQKAIAAGAFHNDVVAVANERVLFTHQEAFANQPVFYEELRSAFPALVVIEVPSSEVSLADAISSYLFNAQLVTLPDGAGMALILPTEAQANCRVWGWLETLIASNGPIRRLITVDVRESMANGGGPACLRLRVVCDPQAVDPRFIVDQAKLDMISAIIAAHWPEAIAPSELNNPLLWSHCETARGKLLHALDLEMLVSD